MKLRTKILTINLAVLAVILVVLFYFTSPLILTGRGTEVLKLYIIVVISVGVLSTVIRTFLFEAFVIRRILDLTSRVNHIKEYRSYYDELHYMGKDEVAALGQAINQMLQRIVSSTNEAAVLNEQLREEKASVERQVAERTVELNAQKARLNASVRSLSIGFIMTDDHNNIVLINDRARQILDANTDQLPENGSGGVTEDWSIAGISKRFGQRFRMEQKMAESLQKRSATEFADIEFGERIIRILINPVLDVDNVTLLGCVIVLDDVTEQKVLERSRDEFFSIASHELRTPLTAIRGNTAMIKQFYAEKVHDETFDEMVNDIHDSSVRLITIVNDFLDASRLEQGKIKFNFESFDITEILENIVYETVELAKEKDDRIIIDKTLKAVPAVYGDRDRVKQIVYNLIGNALKFTVKGEITISARPEAGMLKLLVADTGPGISLDGQKRLFHKFQQAGPDLFTRETSRGTGLGLYISKLLVQRMGGTIGLERSEPGKGTAFFFTLPLQPAPADPDVSAAAPAK